jgi:hypothetical protein
MASSDADDRDPMAAPGQRPQPAPMAAAKPAQGGDPHPRHHALAIASADHLHRNGYISGEHRAAIHAHAKGKLAERKRGKEAPAEFGSLAPSGGGEAY